MLLILAFTYLASLAVATIVLLDPTDLIDPADWKSDNAPRANYSFVPVMYQAESIPGPYTYSAKSPNISHETLTVCQDDSSVLVVANGSEVSVEYTTIVKFGYSSDLYQASFYGLNAAVNVAKESIVTMSHVNVTRHHGTANIFAYEAGPTVTVDHAWLYSSGPTSHGLYAARNGIMYASNVAHYSGGNRCSSFSGDTPAGYLHVSNAVAHTDGIGSAICYALGLCKMANVIGHASHAPVTFSDGNQTTIWKDSDLTADLLARVAHFFSGSAIRCDRHFWQLEIDSFGSTMPALWFGNVNATVNLISTQINNSASGILAMTNYSQVTQDFDHFAGYAANADLSPAQVTLNVQESTISGSLVAYNKSPISSNLSRHSKWTGQVRAAFGPASFGVALDNSSVWTLTANAGVYNFTNSDSTLSNIASNGYNITYSSSTTANAPWEARRLLSSEGAS